MWQGRFWASSPVLSEVQIGWNKDVDNDNKWCNNWSVEEESAGCTANGCMCKDLQGTFFDFFQAAFRTMACMRWVRSSHYCCASKVTRKALQYELEQEASLRCLTYRRNYKRVSDKASVFWIGISVLTKFWSWNCGGACQRVSGLRSPTDLLCMTKGVFKNVQKRF